MHSFLLTAPSSAAINNVKDLATLAMEVRVDKAYRATFKFVGARARVTTRNLWLSIGEAHREANQAAKGDG